MFSTRYLTWAKETGQKNLTNSQHKFAEFLLKEHKTIKTISDTDFKLVRKFIKDNPEIIAESLDVTIEGTENQKSVDFLLKNHLMIGMIGGMGPIFKSIKTFI